MVLDVPWWRCSGRALLRGLRMPGELPAGCHYSRRTRLLDEWRLALRVWRKDRSEPESESESISRHGSHVALQVLRSKRAVQALLASTDEHRHDSREPPPRERRKRYNNDREGNPENRA